MRYLLFTIITIILLSCAKQEDNIPFYIQIDDIILDENTSENITDAWVYINDNKIGIYELPAKFPVLAQGEKELKIRAGIKKNGIAATRVFYPFYEVFTDSLLFKKDSVYIINPIVNYKENIDWNKLFVEDFIGGNQGIQFENSGQNMNTIKDTIIENRTCGYIILDSIFSNCETKTTTLNFPQGSEIYLEMDYKSDSSSFIVGLQSNYFNDTINEPIMNIFPKSEWNKIYIDLSNVVNARINATSFNIYLYIDKPNNSMLRSLYIDNFKIIHL